ncbi:restriction endonuclease [Vibrio sp. 10N.222.47.A9]|uniref:restriction endonuclease subunit S n=1 Tax=Vibrio sp. 10N.222.47.A9 TaxID=1903178 RepID=UPI00097539C9|nr:restriction endonuclease subunit S [Vibrio sp. 10N.222.47.A9]OMO32511.1 restriction endonuclease [Vibrio sp. 10N.222.47.A9]
MNFDVKYQPLNEIADVIDSLHKTPKYSDTGIPMVRCVDLNYGILKLDGTRRVSEEVYKEYSKKYSPKKDDIIITRVGANFGDTSYVGAVDFCLGQNTAAIIPHINKRYIYYVLNSKYGRQKMSEAVAGAAQPTLSLKAIRNMEIPRLDGHMENKVSEVLGNLDDKIDLNSETNKILEQVAQAIFKSWFVDFEPVKAKMNGEQPEGIDAATASLFPEKLVSETGLPEGWIQSEIGDEVTVVGGGTPSKKIDDFWVDGDIHWTSPKDLSGVQDKVLLDTASKVTEAGLRKISSGLLPIDTVLLSSRAPVGYLALAKVPMAINQGYIAMKCEKQLPPEFVLQWCVHRMDEIKQRASGSTFAEISKKSFKPISVVVPTDEVLSAYQKLVKPLYDAITSNARQNEQLSTLRDTLLPKLLSGEIKLEEENNLTGALA